MQPKAEAGAPVGATFQLLGSKSPRPPQSSAKCRRLAAIVLSRAARAQGRRMKESRGLHGFVPLHLLPRSRGQSCLPNRDKEQPPQTIAPAVFVETNSQGHTTIGVRMLAAHRRSVACVSFSTSATSSPATAIDSSRTATARSICCVLMMSGGAIRNVSGLLRL